MHSATYCLKIVALLYNKEEVVQVLPAYVLVYQIFKSPPSHDLQHQKILALIRWPGPESDSLMNWPQLLVLGWVGGVLRSGIWSRRSVSDGVSECVFSCYHCDWHGVGSRDTGRACGLCA